MRFSKQLALARLNVFTYSRASCRYAMVRITTEWANFDDRYYNVECKNRIPAPRIFFSGVIVFMVSFFPVEHCNLPPNRRPPWAIGGPSISASGVGRWLSSGAGRPIDVPLRLVIIEWALGLGPRGGWAFIRVYVGGGSELNRGV